MSAKKSEIFGKYDEFGAYHWGFTYIGGFRRSSPRSHALYDVPLRIVSKRLGASLVAVRGADVGCGDGVLVYKAMKQGGTIIGIDLTQKALTYAAQEISKRSSRRPSLINSTCYKLPLPSNSLDFIVSTELIEHLHYDENFTWEAARVLRPGGVFICTTPNQLQDGPPIQDDYHIREYTSSSLHELLSRFFVEVEVLGLYPSWLDNLYFCKNWPHLIGTSSRFAFKIVLPFYNPYSHFVVSNVTNNTKCANLIGIGAKQHSPMSPPTL